MTEIKDDPITQNAGDEDNEPHSDHEEEDDDGLPDDAKDNLYVSIRCRPLAKKPANFLKLKSEIKQFFKKLDIELPLFKMSDSHVAYLLMKSKEDREKFIKEIQENKNTLKLFNANVAAHRMKSTYESFRYKLPGNLDEALDHLMPLRQVPYATQIETKVAQLKQYTKQAETETVQSLSKTFPKAQFDIKTPTFEKAIPLADQTGFHFDNVVIEFELSEDGKVTAGSRMIYGDNNKKDKIFFVPIDKCVRIAAPIIKATEAFVKYLNDHTDKVAPYNTVDKTGLVYGLKCSSNSAGDVLMTVRVAYNATNDEFIPIDDVDKEVELTTLLKEYRKKNGTPQNAVAKKAPEIKVEGSETKVATKPGEVVKGKPRGRPEWSSESGNPEGYKFVLEKFATSCPELVNFDFGQADSHLDKLVPYLKEFYDENKTKVKLAGIYVGWYIVSKRPTEWNRHMRLYHHVCGDTRINELIADHSFHKFAFTAAFMPRIPNTGAVLTLLLKKLDIKKSTGLALCCEYRSIILFFAKKCQHVISVNHSVSEIGSWFNLRNKNRIEFASQMPNNIDFAFRKAKSPTKTLILWGNLRKAAIKRFIHLGVQNIAVVLDKVRASDLTKVKLEDPSKAIDAKPGKVKQNLMTVELGRISHLAYPYLTLKRIVPVDSDPGGEYISVIAFFHRNANAPALPEIVFQPLSFAKEQELLKAHGAVSNVKRMGGPEGPDGPPLKRSRFSGPGTHFAGPPVRFGGGPMGPSGPPRPFGPRQGFNQMGSRDGPWDRFSGGDFQSGGRGFGPEPSRPMENLNFIGQLQELLATKDHLNKLISLGSGESRPSIGNQGPRQIGYNNEPQFSRGPVNNPPRNVGLKRMNPWSDARPAPSHEPQFSGHQNRFSGGPQNKFSSKPSGPPNKFPAPQNKVASPNKFSGSSNNFSGPPNKFSGQSNNFSGTSQPKPGGGVPQSRFEKRDDGGSPWNRQAFNDNTTFQQKPVNSGPKDGGAGNRFRGGDDTGFGGSRQTFNSDRQTGGLGSFSKGAGNTGFSGRDTEFRGGRDSDVDQRGSSFESRPLSGSFDRSNSEVRSGAFGFKGGDAGLGISRPTANVDFRGDKPNFGREDVGLGSGSLNLGRNSMGFNGSDVDTRGGNSSFRNSSNSDFRSSGNSDFRSQENRSFGFGGNSSFGKNEPVLDSSRGFSRFRDANDSGNDDFRSGGTPRGSLGSGVGGERGFGESGNGGLRGSQGWSRGSGGDRGFTDDDNSGFMDTSGGRGGVGPRTGGSGFGGGDRGFADSGNGSFGRSTGGGGGSSEGDRGFSGSLSFQGAGSRAADGGGFGIDRGFGDGPTGGFRGASGGQQRSADSSQRGGFEGELGGQRSSFRGAFDGGSGNRSSGGGGSYDADGYSRNSGRSSGNFGSFGGISGESRQPQSLRDVGSRPNSNQLGSNYSRF